MNKYKKICSLIPTMKRSQKITLALGLALITLTAGILIVDYIEDQSYDVRIGYLEGDIHHLAFYVARNQSLYENAGINMRAVAYQNGGEVMNAFASANRPIDMGYLGFAPALMHRITNPAADITVLAAANLVGSAIVVDKNANIESVADLTGKRVAVPAPNNMQDFILSIALNDNGLTYDDITHVVNMHPSDMVLALERTGDQGIDAFVAWEPHASKAVHGGSGKILLNSSDIWPNHPCCVVTGHNTFINNRRDVVEKVIEIHVQATEWILENPEEAIQIAVHAMGLSQAEAEAAFYNVEFVSQPDLETHTEFLHKLVELNDMISMDSPQIPEGMNESEFINHFIDTIILDSL